MVWTLFQMFFHSAKYKVPKWNSEQLWFWYLKKKTEKIIHLLLSVVHCYISQHRYISQSQTWFVMVPTLVHLRSHAMFNNSYCEKLNLGVPNISWQNGWGRMAGRVRKFVCLDIGDSSCQFGVCVWLASQGAFNKCVYECVCVCSNIYVTCDISLVRVWLFGTRAQVSHVSSVYVCVLSVYVFPIPTLKGPSWDWVRGGICGWWWGTTLS